MEKKLENIHPKGIKKLWKALMDAYSSFMDDKCLKKSAALAYYTIFSIGPLMLIVIWLLGFFYRKEIENTSVEEKVFQEMEHIFGTQTAEVIQTVMENMSVTAESNIGLIIGISILIFSSTGIFIEIKDSLNEIWKVKPKPKKNWLLFIFNRLVSFSMVLGMGFLLTVSLLITSIIRVMSEYLGDLITGISNEVLEIANEIIGFLMIFVAFSLIFKILPDVKVKTGTILKGAFFTTILFVLGRYGITIFLKNNATVSAYGAAGSLILLLLWVYYSSAILYFGAEFTRAYAELSDEEILPVRYAVKIEQTEIELDNGKES